MQLNKNSLSSLLIHMIMSFSLVFLFQKITTFSLSLTLSLGYWASKSLVVQKQLRKGNVNYPS